MRRSAWRRRLWVFPAGALAALALCALVSSEPLRAARLFFLGPFESLYRFGNMLGSSTVLVLSALGASLALRGGLLNLGGEGQIALGGFAAAMAALGLEGWGPWAVAPAVALGALAAGLLALLSGWCKARWDTSEMISSFLLSQAAILVVDHLVSAVFIDPASNLLSTRRIPASMWLGEILPPSNLTWAFVLALGAAAAAHLALWGTKGGYKLRMCGQGGRFASYCGIDQGACQMAAMFVSGALHGAGGALAVFGTYHMAFRDFQAGMGWNGFATALLAGSAPLMTVPAALFFSWVESGARIATQKSDLSVQVASLVRAAVFLLATVQLPAPRRRRP